MTRHSAKPSPERASRASRISSSTTSAKRSGQPDASASRSGRLRPQRGRTSSSGLTCPAVSRPGTFRAVGAPGGQVDLHGGVAFEEDRLHRAEHEACEESTMGDVRSRVRGRAGVKGRREGDLQHEDGAGRLHPDTPSRWGGLVEAHDPRDEPGQCPGHRPPDDRRPRRDHLLHRLRCRFLQDRRSAPVIASGDGEEGMSRWACWS